MFRENERTVRKGKEDDQGQKKKSNRVRRRIVKMDGGNNKVKTCVYEGRSLGRREVKLQKRERKGRVRNWSTYVVPAAVSLRIATSHNSVAWF
jgi:hypothetical protein